MKVLGCPCKYSLSSGSGKATEYVQGCMQIQYRKVRLRAQDQREFSVICRPLWRKMAPQERGRVDLYGVVACYWYGFLSLVWFSTIGVDFYHLCGLLPLVCFSIIGMVPTIGMFFLLLVWFSIIGMIFFY